MRKRFLIFASLLIISSCVTAQELLNDSVVKEPSSVVRLSLLIPSFQVEQTIVRNSTVVLDLWTSISYFQFQAPDYIKSRFSFIPGFTVTPRFYTSLEIRKAYNLVTDCYSGTYIGLPVSIISYQGFVFSCGLIGGFQRKLGKSGFWNIDVGACYRILEGNGQITPIADLRMGFMIY